MFTTGSKLYFGISALALAAMALYAALNRDEFLGPLVLGSLCVASLFLGFVVVVLRDAHVAAPAATAASATDAEGALAGSPRVGASPWPLVGAVGALMVVLGLATDVLVLWAGVVVLLAAGAEWMIQAWADRASADPSYNQSVRDRLLRPIEFPIIAALVAALIAGGFSRIMLAASEIGSVVVFSIVAALVFGSAIFLASRPQVSRQVSTLFLVLGALLMVGMGAIGIVAGPREFEKKEKPGVTEGVSDPASVGATVTVRGNTFAFDGPFVTEPGVLEWAKGTTVNLVFRNTDPTPHNLVVRGGEGDNAVKFETALLEQGAVQVLTVRIDVPGEYEIVSEGGPVAVKGIVRVL